MVGRFFRPSSRDCHILIADGIQDLDETFVRVKGVEKLLLFLPKTYIKSLIVLYLEALFVELKFNLQYIAKGQASIRRVTLYSFRIYMNTCIKHPSHCRKC